MNKHLQQAIDQLSDQMSQKELTRGRVALTNKYRDVARHGKAHAFMDSDSARISYLNTRFPATYAAIVECLDRIKVQQPDLNLETMTDLGAGPGTAFFASLTHFPLEKAILVEQDPELIRLGKHLQASIHDKAATWELGNLQEIKAFPSADLVTISYALNELDSRAQHAFIEKAWQATKKVLLIVEPGSRQGFSLIRQARQQLIDLGAHMIAPCPHALTCPMPDNDWCHFSKRVNRSSLHRQLKNATLGYEDEKFSYIAFGRKASSLPEARVIRHPEKHSGHLLLTLCTKGNGLLKKTLSKKDGPAYKAARKLEWGDTFNEI